MGLAEFASFVVEVFGGGDVVEEGPGLFGGDQRGGEDNCVEGDVVFAHELVEFYVFVLPPLFVVFLEEVGGDGDVADAGIEPDVEHFVFELFDWNRYSPFQVSSNAFGFQPHV